MKRITYSQFRKDLKMYLDRIADGEEFEVRDVYVRGGSSDVEERLSRIENVLREHNLL